MKLSLILAFVAALFALATAQSSVSFVEAQLTNAPAQVATIATPSNVPMDEDAKIDAALQAIGEDLISKSKSVKSQATWLEEVKKIMKLYNGKALRVGNSIAEEKKQIKALYIKKRQLQNLKIQRALEKRMEEATADLTTLDSKLDLVKTRATEFTRTRTGITSTIDQLKAKLNELKGVKPAAKAAAPVKKF